jgi:rhamnose utilization protein RhaD (predicted bifunctional aldolase and dehydrogenase)
MPDNFPVPPADFAELRSMSQRLGSDLTLVQGSGGNTSVKDGNVIWVKASGTWLINAEEQDILVPVDLSHVKEILASGGSDFNDATLAGTLRPSIETSLHCQLNHRVVIHVHSVNAIAWNVRPGARERLEIQLSGIDWRYIPYAKPGASLTAEVNRVLADEPGDPTLLVLENHGLVLGGETCASVEALLADVESRLKLPARVTARPSEVALATTLAKLDDWRLPKTPDIHEIALDNDAIQTAVGGALVPDHAVFLKKKVPVCESLREIPTTLTQYQATLGEEPDWMIVRNVGVILSNRIGSAGEAQLRGLAMIALGIPIGATVRYIDQQAAEDLRAWDAEKYRKELDEELSRSTDQ